MGIGDWGLGIISIWNTNLVENMANIFCYCSSLKELPDISKWNTDSVINMPRAFKNCSSLRKLPNISEWNLKNVINLKSLFEGCSSLLTIPDISKWKINYACNINKMFYGCSSLISQPDISKWNIYVNYSNKDLFDFTTTKSEKNSNSSETFKIESDNNINECFEDCLTINSNQEDIDNINGFKNGKNDDNPFDLFNRNTQMFLLSSLTSSLKLSTFSSRNPTIKKALLSNFLNEFDNFRSNLLKNISNEEEYENLQKSLKEKLISDLNFKEKNNENIKYFEQSIDKNFEENNEFQDFYYEHFYDDIS